MLEAKFIADNWKLIVIAALVASNALFFHLWQSTKDEYLTYAGGVTAVAKQAIDDKERIESERDANLTKVKEHEANLPTVRAGAVAAYLRMHPNTSCGAMPGIAKGKQTDDGASKECVPDAAFVEDAADDADKIASWQEWAHRNKIPLESSDVWKEWAMRNHIPAE